MITKYLVKMSLTTNPGAKVDSGLKLMCNTWFTILPVWLITWLFSWFQCNKYFSVTWSTCQERRNSHFKSFCSRNYLSTSAGGFLVPVPHSWVFYFLFSFSLLRHPPHRQLRIETVPKAVQKSFTKVLPRRVQGFVFQTAWPVRQTNHFLGKIIIRFFSCNN